MDAARPTRVAIQGEHGSFSHEAMSRFWGPDAQPAPHRTCEDVVRSVETGRADAGLLPLENSLAGTVTASYEALLASEQTNAVGEVVVPIHHCVLGLAGASLEDLRTVESHPVALAQCRAFLDAHPHLQTRTAYDTAGAARAIAEAGDPARAAIAGRAAAACHGLDILAADVEDRPDNQTRFVAIATEPAGLQDGAPVRSILVVATPNEPGALVRVLRPFADHDLNLSKLESRPTGEPWSYRFILEFEHVHGSDAAEHALERVRATSLSHRLIGTFRRAATG